MPLETNIEFLYFSVSLCRPTRADGQTPLTLGIIRHNAQSSRYTSLRYSTKVDAGTRKVLENTAVSFSSRDSTMLSPLRTQ
jgi:hypothetical protein